MSKRGAEGIPNPSAEVAARKAARPAAAENLVAVPYGKTGGTLNVSFGDQVDDKNSLIVAFVSENAVTSDAPIDALRAVIGEDQTLITQIIKAQNYKAKAGSSIILPVANTEKRILLVGLGNIVDGTTSCTATTYITMNGFRNAVHSAMNAIKAAKPNGASVFFPTGLPVSTQEADGSGVGVKPYKKENADKSESKTETPAIPDLKTPASAQAIADAFIRQFVMSNHVFDKYLLPTTSNESNFKLENGLQIVVPAGEVAKFQEQGQYAISVAESVIFSREIGNDRSDVVNPQYMEDLARKFAETHSDVVKIRVLQQDELIAQGFNLITAVGRAAPIPPRIVALEYNGLGSDAEKYEWLAYVGKGITFDTGGLNLKPTGFMEEMHMDMCGSAAVFGALRALVLTRAKVKIVVVLALAENVIDAKSYKPHSIIDTYIGSVQIGNTDAEGRLALADALTFVQNEYKPSNVVDIATLTGACVVALGEYAAGLFSNSNEFASTVAESGKRQNERFWRLPIFPEHIDEMKGDQSDWSSTGKGRYGGASTAAAFLEKFIQPGVAWSHLDVAGPAAFTAPRGYLPKGATAYGVQTLVELAQTFASQE